MTYITPILSRERAGGSGEPLPTCLWYKESFDMCFCHFYQLDGCCGLQSLTLTQQIMPVWSLRSSSDFMPAAYGYKSAISISDERCYNIPREVLSESILSH
jgi:hypothetical protein